MRQKLYLCVSVSSATLMAVCASAPVAAQDAVDQVQSPVPGGTVQEEALPAPAPDGGGIVVTGSRIQRNGLQSPTPVTVLSSDDLNSLSPGSVTNALDRLPAFLNSSSTSGDATSGVSDAGGTNLNLRGLGANRTLTLLNSHRVVPNNKEGAVNIDIFPQLLVQRVDVVTGGASAAYGTDAVAGVVNFILDTRFEGIKGNVQAGITRYGDNPNGQIQLAAGTLVGDRLHLTISGEYSRESGVKSYYDRDWYQSGSLITNPAYAADHTARPIYIPAYNVVGTNFTCGGLVISPNAAINGLEFLPDGSYAPFVESNLSASGPGTNNAQSLQNSSGGSGCDPKRLTPLSADHEKGLAFASAVYDVSDDVSLNLQGLFAHDWANFGPSQATMAPTRDATIYSGNPFLPTGIQALMTANKIASFKLSRDNSDLFPAETNKTYVRNRTFMVTGGVDATINTGGLFDQWKGTAYVQYGQNQQRASFFGKANARTLYTALDAVRDPNGNIVCRAALVNPAQYSDCVPLNLFGEGQASDSAIHYVTTPLKGEAGAIVFHYLTKEIDAEASLSGEVFGGLGAGPVSAAIGASYRKQSVSSSQAGLSADTGGVPFNETQPGGTPGVRGIPGSIAGDPDAQLFDSYADVQGSQTVKEVFGELDIPLLADSPVAHEMSLNLAARYADYSGSGGIWAYKAGLDWALSSGIRLRGTYSRDVRAASLSEAFDAQRTNGTVNNDPVTGLTYNFSQTTGGNPNVAPEKADTITAGLVLQPAFLPGFGMSIDYYKITINDAINQLGTQRIVDQCASGSKDLCALITRDPGTGIITDLRNVFINIAEEKASGLDVEIDYRSPVSLLGGEEELTLRGLASFLFERTLSIPGSGLAVLDGQLATLSAGDDFAYPHLQMTGNASYTNGPITFTVTERYVGGGHLDNTYVEGVDVANNHVQPVWYTDFGITYTLVHEGPHKVDLYGFVTNLFNVKPPFAPEPWSTLNGSFQTNRQLYDFLGQRFLVGARFSF